MIHIFLFSFFSIAYANIPIGDSHNLKAEGFLQVLQNSATTDLAALPAKHSLSWPVEFENKNNTMGNSMIQYQPFGDPYFHGGCDLRVSAQAEVRSPVSGKLEAGHYSYTKNSDGSLNKFWKPWPQSGDSLYFEIAVVDSNNIRYEFHHIDKATLPQEIVDKLNSNDLKIEKNNLIGRAIRWPSLGYHHIHYNIILPDGTRANPEYFSPLIYDQTNPEMKVYIKKSTIYEEVFDKSVVEHSEELVVFTSDKKDFNSYEQPPVKVTLTLGSKKYFEWNFEQFLLHENKFPNLWAYLISKIRTNSNGLIFTSGGYGEGKSLIRIPVAKDYAGPFSLETEDNAGNKNTLTATFLP
ncbi:MAG: hypothetical protein M9962_15500 [Oligoflexia bacterium]|nr:hypothetical protein [Oligoflexia bacterium]